MLDVKPLKVVNVPFIPVTVPLFFDAFHVIAYEPMFSCDNFTVIEDVVDDILAGRAALPGT